MKTLLLFVLSISLEYVCCQYDKRASTRDKGDHYLVCEQEPIELGIVLDSSRSIRKIDFEKGKTFLQNYLSEFDIGDGRNDIRVSVITFGKGIYKEDAFNLTTYRTKEEVLQAVGEIPFRSGPYTDTGKAIEFMHKHQLTDAIVRPWASKVSVVITDGDSQKGRFTNQTAAAARDDGINMFVIGIGRVRDRELMGIAGDRERIRRVSNYDALDQAKQFLVTQTCVRKPKTTTTQIPTPHAIQLCGEMNPADIEFVFSPADLDLDAVAFATSFISLTTDSEDMQMGFQYGVTTGLCPYDQGFALNRYDDVDDIREHLIRYDKMKLPGLVQHVVEHSFTSENGAREDSRKVAVLFVSNDKGIKGGDLQAKIKALRAKGVEVYIADPSDQGIAIEGATTLQGRSSRQQSDQFVTWLCPQGIIS